MFLNITCFLVWKHILLCGWRISHFCTVIPKHNSCWIPPSSLLVFIWVGGHVCVCVCSDCASVWGKWLRVVVAVFAWSFSRAHEYAVLCCCCHLPTEILLCVKVWWVVVYLWVCHVQVRFMWIAPMHVPFFRGQYLTAWRVSYECHKNWSWINSNAYYNVKSGMVILQAVCKW
jgi:hypothetical protein